MDSARIAETCQEFSVGVIPPDGTQLSLAVWMKILGMDTSEETSEEESFVRQLNRDGIPHPKIGGMMYVDSTHIRRVIFMGRTKEPECQENVETAKDASPRKRRGRTKGGTE